MFLAPLRNFVASRPVLVLAITLALLALSLSGCKGRSALPSSIAPPRSEAHHAEPAAAKVRRLEGELRSAKLERDDARLAGARTLLNWCTGILALCTVGGIVAAIFMKSKLLAYAALACAGGAASAQVFQRALDHIHLISWLTLAAVVCVGGWMVWRYYKD